MGSGDPNSGPHTHKANTLSMHSSSQSLGIHSNVVISQGPEIGEGELGCSGYGEFSVAGVVQVQKAPIRTRRSYVLSRYSQIKWLLNLAFHLVQVT